MKKKIFMLLALLMTAATGAWAQNDNCAEVSPFWGKTLSTTKHMAPRRAIASFGDLEKSFECSSAAQYGVATDGNRIYTSAWNPDYNGYTFFEYDFDGNFIDAFNIDGVTLGVRDMTYDGEYFYGSTCSNTVYQLDLANRTLVGTLYIPLEVRAITYDPTNDGFWAMNNWSNYLALYDRSGNLIKNGQAQGSISGCAYYEDTDGEEHVLQFCNHDYIVYDYNITKDELSGGVFNYYTLPGANGSSGGCFISEYEGQMCFFGDIQNSPTLIGIYALPDAVGAEIGGETGDCQWRYNEKTKTLTIFGNGAMEDYADVSEQPWADFALDIETVIIKKGVTRIGDRAFLDLKNMSFVSIPNGVESIGNYAFYDCWSLPFVSIPASVTDMGLDAFWLCLRLRNVYMYADVNNLSWLDTDCDDFTFGTLAVCHVAGSIAPWKEKYEKKVNVNFKGDLEEIPEEYANEGAFRIKIVDNDFGKVTTFVDGAQGKMAEAGAAVMVKVQPLEGYIAELVYGHGYMVWEEIAARAAAPTMDLINELEVSKLKDNVWAFAMPGADVKLSVAYRKLMTHADISFGDIDDMEYTGKTLTPEVTVYDGEDELVEGVDYTVEYTQTVAAGDAVITVRGIGDYAGETTTSFVITAKSGSGLTVEVADAEAGEVPAILVKDENRTLAEGYDYDITFQDAEGKAVTKEEMVPGGSYKAVIDLKANYYGQLTKTFSVSEPEEDPDPSTGIASASRTNGKSAVYGLSGRRVNSNAKGLVISGGKKLLKK